MSDDKKKRTSAFTERDILNATLWALGLVTAGRLVGKLIASQPLHFHAWRRVEGGWLCTGCLTERIGEDFPS